MEKHFFFSPLFSLTGEEAGIPYDKESMAIIRLNNTTVMYLKEVTKFLALVCFLREESFERKGQRVFVSQGLFGHGTDPVAGTFWWPFPLAFVTSIVLQQRGLAKEGVHTMYYKHQHLQSHSVVIF